MSDSESGSSDHDDLDHGTKGKRSRVAKACSGCKSSRRKCSGNQPCEHCIKRGIACVFDEDPPKKRGPKGSARALLEAQNSALRAEIERLKQLAFASGASTTSSGGKPRKQKTTPGPHTTMNTTTTIVTHGSHGGTDNQSIGSNFTFSPPSQPYHQSSVPTVPPYPVNSSSSLTSYPMQQQQQQPTVPSQYPLPYPSAASFSSHHHHHHPVASSFPSSHPSTTNPTTVIPDQLSIVSFGAPSDKSYTHQRHGVHPCAYPPTNTHEHTMQPPSSNPSATAGNKRKLNQMTTNNTVQHNPQKLPSSSSASSVGTRMTTTGFDDPSSTKHASSSLFDSASSLSSSSLTAESIWSIGPVVPTADEEQILQSFFDHSNKMLPAVDEESFYSALRDAAHLPADDGLPLSASSTDNLSSSGTIGNDPLSIAANNLAKIALNSEAFGFRVLYHTVLCAGAKVQGRVRLAKNHYELARAFIGPCFSVPSQHLVSALLVMTMITRALCLDTNQSSLHAALALRMADLVPVTPEVRTVAVLMAYANCNGTAGNKSVAAPPPPSVRRIWNFEALKQQEEMNSVHTTYHGNEKNIDNDPHRRFADILGYALNQLYYRFDSIRTPKEASDFIRLLEEAIEIQQGINIMKNFPLRCLNAGITSIIYFRFGHSQLAMDKMAQAIRLAQADPLTRFSFPVITCIKEMLPLAKELIKIPELQEQEQSLNVRKNACQFLGSADADIQTAAGVHYARSLHCGDDTNNGGGKDFQPVPLSSVKFDNDNDIPEEVKPKPDAPPGSSTITLLPAVLPALPLKPDGNTCPTTGLVSSSPSTGIHRTENTNESGCPTTGNTTTDGITTNTCPRTNPGGVITEGVRICPKTGTVLDAGMALAASVMKGPGFEEPSSPPVTADATGMNNGSNPQRKKGKEIDTIKDASSRTVQTSTLARMTATLMPRRPNPSLLTNPAPPITTDSTALSFLQQGTELPLTCNSNIPIPALDHSNPVVPTMRVPLSSAVAQPSEPSFSSSTVISHYHNPFSTVTNGVYNAQNGTTDFDNQTINSAKLLHDNTNQHEDHSPLPAWVGDDDFYRMVQDAYGDLSADFDRQPELLTPTTPGSLSSANDPIHLARPSHPSSTTISPTGKTSSHHRPGSFSGSSFSSSTISSSSLSTEHHHHTGNHSTMLSPVQIPTNVQLTNTVVPGVSTPSLDSVKGRTLMDNFDLLKGGGSSPSRYTTVLSPSTVYPSKQYPTQAKVIVNHGGVTDPSNNITGKAFGSVSRRSTTEKNEDDDNRSVGGFSTSSLGLQIDSFLATIPGDIGYEA